MARLKCPAKLLPLLQKKKRFKIVYGGRGGGKSNTIADLLLMLAQKKGEKIGCFREMQNSIEDSVHSLLKDEIVRLELNGFDTTNNAIRHAAGGEFKFKGLARNPESVKSMHGFKKFWIEEAQSISGESLKQLTPTLREEESELWFSLNRMSSKDPVSQRFFAPFEKDFDENGCYEDDMHLIIRVNYLDNPFFPAVLEQERRWDYENLPRSLYNHIWLGDYNDTVDNAIIPVEWFEAAIDAHLKEGKTFKAKGQKIVTHDPSDKGGDAKGLCYRHGSVVLDVQEMNNGDVNDGCDWATQYAIDVNSDVFIWDCDGLGASLRRQVSGSLSGKKIETVEFKGSESASNPKSIYQPTDNNKQARTNIQTFKNHRAQCYWMLRDRFFNTYRSIVKGEYIDPDDMISLSSDIKNMDKLRSELCRVPLKHNGSGLIQIMTKVEMQKLKIPSPNMADAVMMSMANPPPVKVQKPLDYPKMSIA